MTLANIYRFHKGGYFQKICRGESEGERGGRGEREGGAQKRERPQSKFLSLVKEIHERIMFACSQSGWLFDVHNNVI